MRRKNLHPESLSMTRRVLMTTDNLGGVWTYALELTRALASYGVQVALATMGSPLKPGQIEETRQLRNLEVFEKPLKLEWMGEPWEDVESAGAWLLELERQVSPDIVHLNGYSHGALPFAAPKVVVGHSCVLSWWQAVRREAAPERWNRYREAVTAGLRAADLVVAPSQHMLSQLEGLYGPFSDTEVILNGRALPGMRWQTKDELIVTAGRLWDDAKNIGALAAVANRIPWPINVAGEERHPDGGVAHLEGLKFLGRLSVDELSAWYSRAAIYALPARYEPFGLSALEAGLGDCALVLGDIPSLREIWGRAAVYVHPEDPDELRHAIVSLMTDWRRLISLGVRARNRAQELTPLRMAAGYLSAYGRLLERARAREKEEMSLCVS